ncbi:four helix bundle protein [Candidatus Poribacteria bacterium]|nr:MAG: four helix bundle protein [Candidatus Poribacteria bacterium]
MRITISICHSAQVRRACTSIPTNIAEGCGRGSSVEFARFLQIAMGSASETEYLIFLSHDLKYIDDKQYKDLSNQIIKIKKMLATLIKKIRTEE